MDSSSTESQFNSFLKCERCWSTEDVQLFQFMATGQPAKHDDETGIPLCRECRVRAPRDPVVFKEIFLRFGSPKELLSTYSVSTEKEAIARLCQERNLDFDNILTRLYGSRAASKPLPNEKTGKVGTIAHLMGPFGYQYDDMGLAVNANEAKVVIEIFSRYMSGLGIAKICRELNKKGFKTRTGKVWASQTVANILSNPIYCGFAKIGDELKAGQHRNLVSVDIFNRVQEEMQRRIRRPDQKSENRLTLPHKQADIGDSQ